MVERSLFAIIGLLQGANFMLLYFIWRVGDDFHKKPQVLENYFVYFITLSCFNVITAPETLKGNREIQGFALIRAVLFETQSEN